jgi:hypothetical protein
MRAKRRKPGAGVDYAKRLVLNLTPEERKAFLKWLLEIQR